MKAGSGTARNEAPGELRQVEKLLHREQPWRRMFVFHPGGGSEKAREDQRNGHSGAHSPELQLLLDTLLDLAERHRYHQRHHQEDFPPKTVE